MSEEETSNVDTGSEDSAFPKIDRSRKDTISQRKDQQGVVEFNAKQIEALGLNIEKNSTKDLRTLVYNKLGVTGISMKEDKDTKDKPEKIKPKKNPASK